MKQMARTWQFSLCVLMMAVIAVMTSGCGKKAPDYNEAPSKKDGFVHSVRLGTTVRYDLDGDGIGDDITVNAQEYEQGTLIVGNAKMGFDAVSPTGYFTILNVDQNDDALLIGISDYGFSDDPVTVLYAYDGARLKEIGWFYDITGENEWGYDKVAALNGDGTICATETRDVLGTWKAEVLYRVESGALKDITDFYQYVPWDGESGGWNVTTKTALIMNEEIGNFNAKVIIPGGTRLEMTGMKKDNCENTYWACFKTSSGNSFWLLAEVVDWVTYVPGENDIITSEEAFDGFYYAG